MGEAAEMILDGTCCEQCGGVILDEPETDFGVPRICSDCRDGDGPDWKAYRKVQRDRRRETRDRAIEELKNAAVAFTIHNDGWHLIVCEPGRVRIDFYPGKSTFVAGERKLQGGWSNVISFVRGKGSLVAKKELGSNG